MWDKLGLSISVLCAIHCLFVPVFVALLPLSPLALTLDEWLHPFFIVLIAPTVFYASRRSYYNKKVVGFLTAGFGLIVLGWLTGHFWLGEWVETGGTLAGSILLIAGHWFNFKHHQTCTNASHHHHPLEESLLNKEETHEAA